LTNLMELNLQGNKLTEVSGLGELTNLTQLHLWDNNLTDLSGLKNLTNLTYLTLHKNAIRELPEWITQLGMEIYYDVSIKAKGIILGNNPLETPPVEIVKEGRMAVKNYFDSLNIAIRAAALGEDGVVRLYEGKLLIVGEGDVGKTFIANQLMFNKVPDGKPTDGIDIHEWPIDTGTIKDFRVNLWDFAGQAINHATHQFFLTCRSLYLFVWAARRDEDISRFDYWLNVIKLLSNDSPVLMVMNKCDSRVKAIDQVAIQKEFPNVIGFHDVSALKGIGIEQLRQRIYTEMVNLPMIGKKLPRQWVDIRSELEAMQEKNYIPYQDYVNICGRHGLNIEQGANLAQYYHDLGVILHFKDDDILKDIVILNPEWATDAVYAVVDNMDIQKVHGCFKQDLLVKAWADYPSGIHRFLMKLMKKFELCFELPGKKEYIVPELLSPTRPEFSWDNLDNLHFEYQYEFMPAGIITRFTVRQHGIIEDDLYWKNGVCLKWNDTRARIICDPFAKSISIKIKGVDPKGMLGVIRCDIEAIHETLNRPEHDERIPCICRVCKAGDKLVYHSYEKIKGLIKNGKNKSQCDNGSDVSIQRLLGEYGIDYRSRQSYDDDMERPRPDDCGQMQVIDAVKEIHSGNRVYSIIGMIIGALAMVGGVILTLNGAIGEISWTASVFGMESELNDAGPGVVLMVIGLFVILITKPKPILEQLIGIMPKLKRDS
ncbi:leucine-rich repeat domain-containing protein, partial [Candidatus Pacearchaeota archaeon]|nr:leucine-rich repeat domain-containing protein [Candidatus Pacearchaeota archaeon]